MSGLSRRESAVGTLGQSIGRLGPLIRSMRPTWHMAVLADLDPPFVARHGIAGIVWDIDGTLTAYHDTKVHPEPSPAFTALRTIADLRHVILSNADERRCKELALMFPDIPVVRQYQLGNRLIPRHLLADTDSWNAVEREEYRALGAIAIRKPSGSLLLEAIAAMGIEPSGAVMVGDQYLTDVAGANLAGVRSIKVPTLARDTYPRMIRFSQWLETTIFAVVHRGRTVPTSAAG